MITYSLATLNDVSALVECRLDFLGGLQGDQSTGLRDQLSASLEAYFKSAMKRGDFISYIARDRDSVAGVGGMHIRFHPGNYRNIDGVTGYIMNMYTLPAYRRQGICTRLLTLLQAEGIRKGVRVFELHATSEGEPLYKKEGFYIHHEPTLRRIVKECRS